MGIEPTGDERYSPPNGFEDRERHQPAKHFPPLFRRKCLFSNDLREIGRDRLPAPR